MENIWRAYIFAPISPLLQTRTEIQCSHKFVNFFLNHYFWTLNTDVLNGLYKTFFFKELWWRAGGRIRDCANQIRATYTSLRRSWCTITHICIWVGSCLSLYQGEGDSVRAAQPFLMLCPPPTHWGPLPKNWSLNHPSVEFIEPIPELAALLL